VNQDYRLLLLRLNGSSFEIVSSSNNPQTGLPGQRPTERITYITGGVAAVYGVAIQRVNGNRNVHLHLLTPNRELDRRVPAMSLGNLADVAAVFTVAAVDADAPFPREAYSSEGPTNGPGGAPSGGFLKPDIAAFANVSTASYGTRGFNGTSAAAPHVAGAAAIVLNAYPTALPGEIQDYLQTNAINQGLPGPDPQFGFGRLRLGAPPGQWDYDYHAFVPYVLATP
jgi:subtilisin family serine protease